jgi:glycosyltransferase involved in cell wall biosynthesis
MPTVSVIIPTYQSAKYVSGAIESVLAQTYRDFELIVVDDGSTDETSAVLQPYRDSINVIQQNNQGLSTARNTGIRHAQGQFLAFLDSDDLWFPQKLEKQMALFTSNDHIGLVFSDVEYFEGSHTYKRTCFSVNPPFHDAVTRPLFENNFVPMPTAMIRLKALEDQLIWFDPRLTSCEDYDLWLRISEFWQADYSSEVLARYRISSAQMSANKERMIANLIQVRKAALSRPATRHQISPDLISSVYLRLYLVMARIRLSQANRQAAQQQLRLYAQEGGRSLNAHLLWLLTYMPVRPISRVLSYLEQRHSQRNRWMSSLDK